MSRFSSSSSGYQGEIIHVWICASKKRGHFFTSLSMAKSGLLLQTSSNIKKVNGVNSQVRIE